jgi:hypothetical protein
MPETLRAKLSDAISEPELSKMWESERTTINPATGDGIDTWISAPEVVLETRGQEVRISFPSGGRDPEHKKLKDAFERAVHRYRPDTRVEWQPQTQTAG